MFGERQHHYRLGNQHDGLSNQLVIELHSFLALAHAVIQLRELEARRDVIGEFELNTAFRFGGIPYELAERSLKMFAKEILPVLKGWRSENTARAAAE